MRKIWSIILLGCIVGGVYLSDRSSFTTFTQTNIALGQELYEYDYTNDLYAYLADENGTTDITVVETPPTPEEGEQPNQTVKETKTGSSDYSSGSISRKYFVQKLSNTDTVGWIKVPSTNIDYPIMSYTDNQYYLKHDPNKNPNKCGSVFMDCIHNGEFGKITLLHGHNIKDGKIFSQLSKYAKESVFREKHIISVYDGNMERKYIPFSVFYIDANKESIPVSFKYINGYSEYFQNLKERSMYPMEVDNIDEILILQTCAYVYDKSSGKDGRLIVACYRLE